MTLLKTILKPYGVDEAIEDRINGNRTMLSKAVLMKRISEVYMKRHEEDVAFEKWALEIFKVRE